MVRGVRAGIQASGAVTKNCRRTGDTGISTPSSRPTSAAHGPAASTSHSASHDSPPAVNENPPPGRGAASVTSAPRRSSTPLRRARAA